jgi:hypothetical protein
MAMSNGTLYTSGATTGQLMRSTDNGTTWEEVYQFSSDPGFIFIDSSNFIFVNSWNSSSINRSTDGGHTFSTVLHLECGSRVYGTGSDGGMIEDRNGNLYIGEYGDSVARIWKSTNQGAAWSLIVNWTATLNARHIHALYCAYDGSIYASAGDDISPYFFRAIFRSTDEGETWTKVLDRQPTTITGSSDTVFFGGDDNFITIFKTTDGSTFSDIFTPGVLGVNWDSEIVGLYYSPNGILYASLRGDLSDPTTYSSIYASPDDGVSWALLKNQTEPHYTSMTYADGYLWFYDGSDVQSYRMKDITKAECYELLYAPTTDAPSTTVSKTVLLENGNTYNISFAQDSIKDVSIQFKGSGVTNQVLNPSFETWTGTWPTYWTISKTTSAFFNVTKDTTDTYDGSNALELNISDNPSGQYITVWNNDNRSAVIPNTNYIYTVKMKQIYRQNTSILKDGVEVQLKVDWYTASNSLIGNSWSISSGNHKAHVWDYWQEPLIFNCTSPANAFTADLSVIFYYAGTVLIDAVQLYQSPHHDGYLYGVLKSTNPSISINGQAYSVAGSIEDGAYAAARSLSDSSWFNISSVSISGSQRVWLTISGTRVTSINNALLFGNLSGYGMQIYNGSSATVTFWQDAAIKYDDTRRPYYNISTSSGITGSLEVSSLALGISVSDSSFIQLKVTGDNNGTSVLTWVATVGPTLPICTLTISGLDNDMGYCVIVDGEIIANEHGPSFAFTYSGPMGEHEFEVVETGKIIPELISVALIVGVAVLIVAVIIVIRRRKGSRVRV